MAYLLSCPACQAEGLDPRRSETSCTQCGKAFRLTPHCPDCDSELERVQACGAVDFFCNRCNNLVSKRAARYDIQPQ
ncbi:zinc ribbon domain-containing protein [Pseudaeromonas paramecii]|uniref:Zinc ribbon domain-containing protein n=1 Tax=Pseudaeromonas paramecii TaxID=2138166 RepID=A0ABP8Q4Y3_9GAMM